MRLNEPPDVGSNVVYHGYTFEDMDRGETCVFLGMYDDTICKVYPVKWDAIPIPHAYLERSCCGKPYLRLFLSSFRSSPCMFEGGDA